MEKNGQLTIEALAAVLVGVLIIVIFFQASKAYGSQGIFYELAIAKDIALIIDELYAMPGDVYIKYNKELSKYTIEITSNTIKVYLTELGTSDITTAKYRFFGPELTNIKVKNPEPLVFLKKNGKITLHRGQDDKR